MSHWENIGKSDEHYTPCKVFTALDVKFDIDVAAPLDRKFVSVPAELFITEDSLNQYWNGFVWMNPPFGGRNGIVPWLDKIANHKNGIALVPDRTSAPWYQKAVYQCDLVLMVAGKLKFIKPDGSEGKQPSTGTHLLAYGSLAIEALMNARKNNLGCISKIV